MSDPVQNPLQSPRILIVEDDPDQRELLREAMASHYGRQAAGRVVAVGDGRQCMAQDLPAFDVILLDYNLPDIDGIGLLRKVLAVADVPVIFVTGEYDSALAARAIQLGAEDFVVKMGDYLLAIPVVIGKSISQHRVRKENQRLQAQLELMLEQLRDKNAQLEDSLGKLRTMAATDHLTGLANRRRFSEELQRQFSEAVRYGHDLACCMCDLDHYKQLNDTLGHQLGDDVLVVTAEVIRATLRLSDVAARYGGDEFVLLLPNTCLEEALAVGRRMREDLAARLAQSTMPVRLVTLSMGIASLGVHQPASADVLVSMADRALYAAKAAGKDRIVLYAEPATTTAGANTAPS
jgi:two-component system, cell cycle response regulator